MSSCNWEVSYAECSDISPLDGLQEIAEQMATDLLWNWTNRVYGGCPVTIRPCRQNCGQGGFTSDVWYTAGSAGGRAPWEPALIGGQWFNYIGCGRCGDSCGCSSTPTLKLGWPVREVTEVLLDGEVLPPSSYRLDNRSLLVRTDGGEWPTCQNIAAPPTEPGTWEISYVFGLPVPVGGQIAAGVLAVELAKAMCNDKSCMLPQRVQSITRQGVTVAILDQFEDVKEGRTGIWLVDAWVASVTKPRKGGRVYSVDVPARRYVH